MENIKEEIEEQKKSHLNDSGNWGIIGNLNYVDEKLENILKFLKGNE